MSEFCFDCCRSPIASGHGCKNVPPSIFYSLNAAPCKMRWSNSPCKIGLNCCWMKPQYVHTGLGQNMKCFHWNLPEIRWRQKKVFTGNLTSFWHEIGWIPREKIFTRTWSKHRTRDDRTRCISANCVLFVDTTTGCAWTYRFSPTYGLPPAWTPSRRPRVQNRAESLSGPYLGGSGPPPKRICTFLQSA